MMDAPLMVTTSLSVGIVHDAVIRTSLAKWAPTAPPIPNGACGSGFSVFGSTTPT